MEEENRSEKQSEQEKSPEFKEGSFTDRTKIEPQKLSKSQLEGIAGKLGLELRDESKPREKLPGEIKLPAKLQAVWNYAVNYANKWDMIERGVYKPTLVELDQMKAKKIKLRIDNETGKIVKITPVEEEETDS